MDQSRPRTRRPKKPRTLTRTGPNRGGWTTRFVESIAGDLSATIAADGALDLSLANPHGDVVTTVAIPANQAATTAATAITGWANYDEYGNTTTADPVDGPIGYGWLGTKQRSTTTATAGLTLMGVRLYNAARGLFSALDPVAGGNESSFGYPNDPVSRADLDGRANVGRHQAAYCAGIAALCGLAYYYSRVSIGVATGSYRRLGRSWARVNALQHALWMALIVWDSPLPRGLAARFARGLGVAHERDTKGVERWGSAESKKDLVNNNIGIQVGLLARRNGWTRYQIISHLTYMASRLCRKNCLRITW